MACPDEGGPFSPEGNGLLRASLTSVVEEEVGVGWLDALGLCVLPEGVRLELVEGEAVPAVESFLLLDEDFESLAFESCSC